MALFRCVGNRVSTEVITLNYESGYVNWSANDWGTATLNLTKKICPLIIEAYSQRIMGSATWAGNCTTKVSVYNVKTNAWEQITQVTDTTQTIDVSSITKNKFYTKIKIEVGGTSSDGSVNHVGYAKIKKYYIK